MFFLINNSLYPDKATNFIRCTWFPMLIKLFFDLQQCKVSYVILSHFSQINQILTSYTVGLSKCFCISIPSKPILHVSVWSLVANFMSYSAKIGLSTMFKELINVFVSILSFPVKIRSRKSRYWLCIFKSMCDICEV